MARSDWAAILTEPAAEYTAHTELRRFGLDPYMPQINRRHATRAGAFVARAYPLFPRYLLIPINTARDPAVRFARGICRHRHILADDDGRIWRAPAKVIDAVREAETTGQFNEILHKGDTVTLAYGVLATVRFVMSDTASDGMVELLMPLFGGSRATVRADKIVHHV